jgi:fatty acid desaturase/2-polyprenyl-3-methyl-5-hydroxy-6-metoxy-1,4-benzoquinol methylase
MKAFSDQCRHVRERRKTLKHDPFRLFLQRYVLTLCPLAAALVIVATNLNAWSMLLVAVVAVVAGFTHNALAVLMHEGAHWFFHQRRATNDVLANVLVCLPIVNTVEGYRHTHLLHHRACCDEQDPYVGLYGPYERKWQVVLGFVMDFSGVTAARTFIRRYLHAVPEAPPTPRYVIVALLGVHGLLFWLLQAATGYWWAYWALWIVPLATIPIAINRLRTFVEHHAERGGHEANRTTLPHFLEYVTIAPYGYAHHFEHHLMRHPLLPARVGPCGAALGGPAVRPRTSRTARVCQDVCPPVRRAAMISSTAPAAVVELEEPACVLCGAAEPGEIAATGYDYEYGTSDRAFTFVRCARCAHCYLNPRPTIRSLAAIYPDTYYTRSAEHTQDESPWLARIKERIVTKRLQPLLAGLRTNGAMVDVGAGDGTLLMQVRRLRPDVRLLAVDWSFTAAQIGRFRELDIDYLEAPLEEADLGDAAFDVAVMNQVIEHVWDVRGGLAKLRRAIGPGGNLSISTPNFNGYEQRWFAGRWGNCYFPRHLNLFSSVALRRLLEECGFQVVATFQLAAPLVWVRSFQYSCKARGSRLAALFTDHNLPALAAFSAMDWTMTALGFETSNVQCIARRGPDHGASVGVHA